MYGGGLNKRGIKVKHHKKKIHIKPPKQMYLNKANDTYGPANTTQNVTLRNDAMNSKQ